MNQILRLSLALAGALAGFLTTAASAASADNYSLQPNDLVEIKVFQEPDLTTTARIAADGTINFPLIGTIGVGGRTVSGAAASIRSALAKDYLVDPQVSLTVTDYAKRRFTVLGQVQKGGTLFYPENETLSLLQAIGLAGGYTKVADPAHITLKRRVAGKDTVFKLDAKSMARGTAASDFTVLPGDTITVGESMF
jgi:polysaccharide export outer membrane protein